MSRWPDDGLARQGKLFRVGNGANLVDVTYVDSAARAHQVGEVGPLPALGFFFKDPAGSDEHRTWAGNLAALELHVPQWQVDDDAFLRDLVSQ